MEVNNYFELGLDMGRRDDWCDEDRRIVARLEETRRMRKRAIKGAVAAQLQTQIDKLKTQLSKHRRRKPRGDEE